jgi:hypothetical protein
MGRIVANVRIGSLLEPGRKIECDALVDTGAAYMVLLHHTEAVPGCSRYARTEPGTRQEKGFEVSTHSAADALPSLS